MKTIVHKSDTRGFSNHGWLQANHSFSFANWYNEDRVHFGALRVLNDDVIAPKMGFGTHPHKNMEIITIPLEGELKHRDSMGNKWESVLPGEVQIMSAGTGVEHSEINGSTDSHLSLFQIWVIPNKENVDPRYDQKAFEASERRNSLQVLVSSIGDDLEGPLKIYQDALISRVDLDENHEITYQLKSNNHGVYVMLINGRVNVLDTELNTRDAIGISELTEFKVNAEETSSLLFIEIPMQF
ncbi:pirin-related protein [Formosa agariphila KMM 3901]|uniref:Pirin-related protein n=1 Tax=Formosa agariphila (strain DSM 15362 / KCTC 12365 / LMG 23005 / KMM 3901 / M-2Alg 35-1) TaxID=1347342 RepID=T2KKI8_FORAG|nr:pirin family protein [Formosa agariphila]CDF78931.1 pirin-related protein [Formosa agariphila KMM 3901]